MTLLMRAEVLAEKVAAAGKDIRKACLARSGDRAAAAHDKGMLRMRGLLMKAVLLTGLTLFLIPALRSAKRMRHDYACRRAEHKSAASLQALSRFEQLPPVR
jgi:hypothetical protein